MIMMMMMIMMMVMINMTCQYDDLGNKLKAAQGLADFQTFIATSWQGRSRQSPSFVFGNLSDFLCQSKEGWRHKVGGAEQEI